MGRQLLNAYPLLVELLPTIMALSSNAHLILIKIKAQLIIPDLTQTGSLIQKTSTDPSSHKLVMLWQLLTVSSCHKIPYLFNSICNSAESITKLFYELSANYHLFSSAYVYIVKNLHNKFVISNQ